MRPPKRYKKGCASSCGRRAARGRQQAPGAGVGPRRRPTARSTWCCCSRSGAGGRGAAARSLQGVAADRRRHEGGAGCRPGRRRSSVGQAADPRVAPEARACFHRVRPHISPAIPHAELVGRFPRQCDLPCRPVAVFPRPHVRGGRTGEIVNGAARFFDAPAVGGWRSFRPSGPSLESEDGASTSSGPATTSTSSTSRRRCRCCIAPWTRSATPSRRAVASSLSAPSARRQDSIADAAKRSAQYYVNSRWLGGMLTNWKTISESIKRLRKLDEMLDSGEAQGLHQEGAPDPATRARQARTRARRHQGHGRRCPTSSSSSTPTRKTIAIKEAQRLNIPVAAIVDTNCDPDGITYLVPGNDDAGRAITLYCDLISKAAIDGISRAQGEMRRRHRRCRGACHRGRAG